MKVGVIMTSTKMFWNPLLISDERKKLIHARDSFVDGDSDSENIPPVAHTPKSGVGFRKKVPSRILLEENDVIADKSTEQKVS